MITVAIEESEFKQFFNAQEISIICSQIGDHIMNLLGLQYGRESPQRTTINKLNHAMQLRLGVLGRIAEDNIIDDPMIIVKSLTLVTNIIRDDDEVVMVNHEHELTKTTFGLLSPDTMLDFLLVLLQEGVKSIRSFIHNNRTYLRYGNECFVAIRDMISELRPLAKIPYLPTADSNVGLATMLVTVDTNFEKSSHNQ